ncbi:hypothetical protein CRI70_31045 [Streptomyces sp. Ru87]|nr:hypothetical protein CRI70_31045 [Streptomyces sp. Ru87]
MIQLAAGLGISVRTAYAYVTVMTCLSSRQIDQHRHLEPRVRGLDVTSRNHGNNTFRQLRERLIVSVTQGQASRDTARQDKGIGMGYGMSYWRKVNMLA